ncbi:uncharacterized protein L969DRAFT_95252 [Mixia osmundae IAM 14324]|uniref:Uncharacterized protein n=1 Tax=Mixia osmundae (strain CBS 9802 / IAM 14324 / JCM 22182 / KY 12970) TaxID=764103 RepID=G7E6Q1_MIXOS|nr:uncharacterized protein L969DRAFT_95252 [Mixia osmundae IAM 14324]KEI39109.1 hypothetical protein L969DRAFT_95252 [Mixia osmundae IAM 14324]GAA98511.1 hypothetical protein E5Q_05197 [Mixia osmundae IAM 14324]
MTRLYLLPFLVNFALSGSGRPPGPDKKSGEICIGVSSCAVRCEGTYKAPNGELGLFAVTASSPQTIFRARMKQPLPSGKLFASCMSQQGPNHWNPKCTIRDMIQTPSELYYFMTGVRDTPFKVTGDTQNVVNFVLSCCDLYYHVDMTWGFINLTLENDKPFFEFKCRNDGKPTIAGVVCKSGSEEAEQLKTYACQIQQGDCQLASLTRRENRCQWPLSPAALTTVTGGLAHRSR